MIIILSLLNNIFNSTASDYQYRLVLDIGTEYIKAIIIKFNSQHDCEIVNYNRVKQKEENMEGGAVSNIEAVIKQCQQAILELKEGLDVPLEEVVMGIAGEFVKGVVTKGEHTRWWAKKKLSTNEIDKLVSQAQQQALAEAEQRLISDMGLEEVKVKLINSSVVDMKVDGYRISNPAEFQGKNLQISVFSTFAPLTHVGALETIATRLGYDLVGIIAEPFAVAKSIMTEGTYEFGAIVIDIGGGTTDIALIRNGGIEGTKMFSLAGRAFTRRLARKFNLSLARAEKLKLKYSRGQLNRGSSEVKKVLQPQLNLLYEGIEVALEKLAQNEALPRKIYLCGGGSELKGLLTGLKNWNLYEKLPFFSPPDIEQLEAKKIKGIKIDKPELTGAQTVTPKSLALQATRVKKLKQRSFWNRLVGGL